MSQLKIVRKLDKWGGWFYRGPEIRATIILWQLTHGFNLVELDNYLEESGWESAAAKANRELLLKRRAQALAAHKAGQHELVVAWLSFLSLAMRAGKRMEFLIPAAKLGKKFSAGRKVNSVGPVRAFVRKYLKQNPKAKAGEVWTALQDAQVKGARVQDSYWSAKYIQRDDGVRMTPRQFSNMVSEERGVQGLKRKPRG